MDFADYLRTSAEEINQEISKFLQDWDEHIEKVTPTVFLWGFIGYHIDLLSKRIGFSSESESRLRNSSFASSSVVSNLFQHRKG